jgi:hypothetical protein
MEEVKMSPDNTEGFRKKNYDIDWDEGDEDEFVPYDEEDYDNWDEDEDYEEIYEDF